MLYRWSTCGELFLLKLTGSTDMPITEYDRSSATSNQYPSSVAHIANMEQGTSTNYSRPSKDLEKRTTALKEYINAQDTTIATASSTATANASNITKIIDGTTAITPVTTHVADSTKHTSFATEAQTKTGTNTTLVVSPKTVTAMVQERIGVMYNAIVGNTALAGVTHSSLEAAVNNASAGWKILVTTDQSLDSTITINKNNLEIEFRRGASIKTGGISTTAITVSAAVTDFYLNKARIEGFTTGINIVAGALRTSLRDLRFKSCTTTVVDAGTGTTNLGAITE